MLANKLRHTFLIATSVNGRQLREVLWVWPLMTVEEARSRPMESLRGCREVKPPGRTQPKRLLTLYDILPAYAAAKRVSMHLA